MKCSRPICDYDIVIWLAAFVFGDFYENMTNQGLNITIQFKLVIYFLENMLFLKRDLKVLYLYLLVKFVRMYI